MRNLRDRRRKPRRTSTTACRRASRGKASSSHCPDAEKWLLSDDLLECEELQGDKQAPTPLQAAFPTTSTDPHRPTRQNHQDHHYISEDLTRDKDVLDRRAYLKEQKLLDFAKLMAPRSQKTRPGELHTTSTLKPRTTTTCIKRSLSLAAPERAASTVEMWPPALLFSKYGHLPEKLPQNEIQYITRTWRRPLRGSFDKSRPEFGRRSAMPNRRSWIPTFRVA